MTDARTTAFENFRNLLAVYEVPELVIASAFNVAWHGRERIEEPPC